MRAAVLVAVLVATAQALPANGPAFDVASIKPSAARDTAMRIIWPRGRFSAVNVTMQQFVGAAWVLPGFRIDGGPGWFATDRFNIEATVAADAQPAPGRGMPDAIRLMMQRLLAERFKLAAHWESRPQAIYALVRTKPSGALGPGLRKTNVDCPAVFDAYRRGGPVSALAPCSVQRGPGKLAAGGYILSQFTDTLSSLLEHIVADRTGLAGAYDIDLTWSPDPTTDSGPSLFTAIQEQLGLKLEPSKAPVEVLVIDRLEKPTAD
jgi:uncharacterized protein (TIGR03435 family)